MTTNFDDVGDFHDKFELPNVTHDGAGPTGLEMNQDLMRFRIGFMHEELSEFMSSYEHMDLAGMFDALIDLVYVALGTAHMLGLPWQEGWDAVQMSNMQKERAAADGSNSGRLSSWDVVKPDGWTAPDIEGVLWRHGWTS